MGGYYIPLAAQDKLRTYKYSSVDKSLTSKYVLNPFYNRLVVLFPPSVAPNAITLSGLALVFANFVTVLVVNPSLRCCQDGACRPMWMYVSFALGLFWYQSLDAIDGKQARRTGSSGPLGELFDHGCDALNVTLEVVLVISALNLGLGWWAVAMLTLTAANFYLTTWEEYHTGTLYLSEFSGPVEGLLLIVVVHAITAFKGPAFWESRILSSLGVVAPHAQPDLSIRSAFLVFSAFGLIFNIHGAATNVSRALAREPSLQARGSSLPQALARLAPFATHTLTLFAWCALAGNGGVFKGSSDTSDDVATLLWTPRALALLVGWGLFFAHDVGLVIVSHLSRQPFPSFKRHIGALAALAGLADAVAQRALGASLAHASASSLNALVAAHLALAIATYAHFVYDVVGTICAEYDINCLTIKDKRKAAEAYERVTGQQAHMGVPAGGADPSAQTTGRRRRVA